MSADLERIAPRLLERRCGGWLAASEAGAPLRIGVTAETEDLARIAFAQAVKEWNRILQTKRRDS